MQHLHLKNFLIINQEFFLFGLYYFMNKIPLVIAEFLCYLGKPGGLVVPATQTMANLFMAI